MRIRGLRARYSPDAPLVLHDVDLDLTPGRRVALVGPSGAGKSTLAAVLVRFVDYSGSVTLDGTELRAFAADDTPASDRPRGARRTHLRLDDSREPAAGPAHGLRRETYGVPSRRPDCSQWIDTLPRGLDTPVGAHGDRLSGGQRQRLALARALLADFPILVLDEPGEHLDVETADALTRDLLAATEGRTTLIITHRTSGLVDVDEIVTLEHGRVVERIDQEHGGAGLALAGTATGRTVQ